MDEILSVRGMEMRFIALACLALAACDRAPEIGSPEYAIADAEKEVAAKLKDPSSAQFTEVRVTESGAVCGKVNGKNSFGAFSGATRFVYFPVMSKAANIDRMEMGAFLEGEKQWNPITQTETDFMMLYQEQCLGISRERQAREKAEFMKKYGSAN